MTVNVEDFNDVPVISGQDVLYAIDLANAIRSVGGFPTLYDLEPGQAGDEYTCVLAKTFNCNCKVMGNSHIPLAKREGNNPFAPWYVYFEEQKYADALSNEIGNEVIQSTSFTYGWAVKLPLNVGEIAKSFDQGELPDKYYL